MHYPDAPRTKHLVQLFTTALAIIRGDQTQELEALMTDGKEFFDITLLSINGEPYQLSDIGKGKVVLVDFIAYEIRESPSHNQLLARIYERYHAQGFQIYQISLDADEHFWKNAAINLPWACVHDPQSINSEIVMKSNVRELPTSFIMNRAGEIVKRVDNYAELMNDLQSYLK
jgi:glutathione peroxidase-family protein